MMMFTLYLIIDNYRKDTLIIVNKIIRYLVSTRNQNLLKYIQDMQRKIDDLQLEKVDYQSHSIHIEIRYMFST